MADHVKKKVSAKSIAIQDVSAIKAKDKLVRRGRKILSCPEMSLPPPPPAPQRRPTQAFIEVPPMDLPPASPDVSLSVHLLEDRGGKKNHVASRSLNEFAFSCPVPNQFLDDMFAHSDPDPDLLDSDPKVEEVDELGSLKAGMQKIVGGRLKKSSAPSSRRRSSQLSAVTEKSGSLPTILSLLSSEQLSVPKESNMIKNFKDFRLEEDKADRRYGKQDLEPFEEEAFAVDGRDDLQFEMEGANGPPQFDLGDDF